jgi:hypothetical protein
MNKQLTKIYGFTLFEATLCLLILATLLIYLTKFDNNILNKQKATLLANQSQMFANLFVYYIATHKTELLNSNESMIIITPEQVITDSNITKVNLFRQKPCVSIIKQANSSDIEAIMYYVWGY